MKSKNSNRNKKNFFNELNSNSLNSYKSLNINKSQSLNNLLKIPKSKIFNFSKIKNKNFEENKKNFYRTLTKSKLSLINKENNNNNKSKLFIFNNNFKKSRTLKFNKSSSFLFNNFHTKKNKIQPTKIFHKIINNFNKVKQINEITKIFLKEKIDKKKINKNNSIYKKFNHQKRRNSNFPSMNLNTISTDSEINFENNKNLFHERKFFFSIEKKKFFLFEINKNQNFLKLKSENSKIKIIKDKINLIFDNLSYFNMNFINKKIFKEAFYNLDEKIKGKFNKSIEIFCGLLIEICPYLIKNFNESINEILYIKKPNLKEKLKIENENLCLEINLKLLNDVCEYFKGIFEIFNIIQKKVIDFNYNENEFFFINLNLDVARFYSSFFYICAQNYINKFEGDKKILNKMEIGLKLKKFNSQNEILKFNFNEEIEEKNKINRINNVLNNEIENKIKRIKKQKSILNSSILLNLMKYIKTKDKNKIISNIILNRKSEEKNND